MTVKRTSPSRVMASLKLMPVLSIWLVCLKIIIEKIPFGLGCIVAKSEDIAHATHCYSSITTAESQKKLDVILLDWCRYAKYSFESPSLLKLFAMRFDNTAA
jgi:hypothetical protein